MENLYYYIFVFLLLHISTITLFGQTKLIDIRLVHVLMLPINFYLVAQVVYYEEAAGGFFLSTSIILLCLIPIGILIYKKRKMKY
jgi:hypothetical protein